jgi:conjugal transfer pilus assembly protein TraB
MTEKLREWFHGLTPKNKKALIYGTVAGVILLVTLSTYKSRNTTAAPPPLSREQAVGIDKNLLQKTQLREERWKVETLERKIELLQNNQKSLNEKVSLENVLGKVKPAGTAKGLPRIPTPAELERSRSSLPGGKPAVQLAAGVKPASVVMRSAKVETIGGIVDLSNKTKDNAPKKEKQQRTVYLPPSFMKAVLLTGTDAGTSGNGRANPDPLLLRVQTPAVLPNDVRSNLSGCFVIAEGQGRLDKERVDIRLVSLSCLSNSGKAVIDTPVKGFVTDADAKTGLAGHVVSRMGASAARALIAGIFAGAGDMLRMESTTVSTSGLGSTSTVNPSKVGTYALGSGLASGAQNMSNFYLNLAKQATPVIEVNAGKHVTVVISEGKTLTIKDLGPNNGLTDNDEDY